MWLTASAWLPPELLSSDTLALPRDTAALKVKGELKLGMRWLKASRIHHLKELRPGSRGRSEIRVIFAFDPTRSALLLLGGDKVGNWERWYRDNIPVAERLYIEYTTEGER
jgi:hypothetical protein